MILLSNFDFSPLFLNATFFIFPSQAKHKKKDKIALKIRQEKEEKASTKNERRKLREDEKEHKKREK